MAITARVVINFHAGSASVTTVTANNSTSNSSGTIFSDLVDVNNAATGCSFSSADTRVCDTGGRAGTGSTLDQQINTNMAYRDVSGSAVHSYTLQLTSGHGNVDVYVYCATSYSGQQALSIDVNGTTVTNHDASNQLGGNASAAPVYFANVTPNGSNQVVVTIDNTNQFAVFNGMVVDPLSGPQTLTPSLFTNSQTFYAPTVTRGAVSLAPGLLTNSQTFYAPTVSQGATTLQPSLLTNTQTFYGPTVTRGAVSLAPSLLTNSQTFYAPTVAGDYDFSDDFEAGGGSGTLDGWTIFQPANGPTPSRAGGRYDSGSITAVGSTTWFNGDRGVAVWKLLDFPASGQPDKEIIFYNVGVGPTATPTAELTFAGASHYALAGAVVHDSNTSNINYEFLVVGHRGADGQYTLETKTTTSGASQVSDVGDNAVGSGVTHADIRLRLRDDNTLRWAYRAPGGSSWTSINTTGTPGVSHGGGYTFTSGDAYVGFVAYAFSAVPTAFRGVADEIELVGELGFELLPSLLSNTQTFYAPTVTRGAVSVAPPLVTNSQTFPSPTVSPGAVSLAPGLLTNGQTFYGPTITSGLAIQPPLLANGQTFYGPTVSPGAVSISPPLLDNAAVVYAPTVATGFVLAPPLLTNSQTFPAPTVSAGAATLLPPLVENSTQVFPPTLVFNQTLSAPLLTNSQSFFTHSIGEPGGEIVIPQHSFAEFSGAVVKTKQAPRAPRIKAPKAVAKLAPKIVEQAPAQQLGASLVTNESTFFAPSMFFVSKGLLRTKAKTPIERVDDRLANLERELTTLRRALSSTRGR